MSNTLMHDELDQAIETIVLAHPEVANAACSADVAELLELADQLRDLPRENFKARLKLELEWEAAGRTVTVTADAAQQHGRAAKAVAGSTEAMPSLFGKSWAGYPVRRMNFAFSAALHFAMALFIGAGFLMVKSATPVS